MEMIQIRECDATDNRDMDAEPVSRTVRRPTQRRSSISCQIQLSLLKAFEAAGRTGSFRDAARELRVTPSAVSHAIRKLEQLLCTTLFEREGRAVQLSAEGETLMRHAELAFTELRRGIELVTARGPRLLRLHCAPSFAAKWLLPRLTGFLALHPQIDLRLSVVVGPDSFANNDCDADIVYGRPVDEGLIVLPLGEEVVTPLCAPEMARQIRTPADLHDQLLIQTCPRLGHWEDWFDRNGLGVPPSHGIRFEQSHLAIAAAAAGLGVALESRRLAERDILSGRLAAPLAGRAQDIRYPAHYLVFPRLGRQRHVLRLFAQWLADELELPSGFGF